ncbi:Uncharacterised protein [Chryseobacterium nakagawai]|nr:Uncharacterised protein [Chryseobacterium nakagawai]
MNNPDESWDFYFTEIRKDMILSSCTFALINPKNYLL